MNWNNYDRMVVLQSRKKPKDQTMTTLSLSDSLLNDYVAMFQRLESKDQAILLDTLAESTKKDSVRIDQNDKFPVYYFPKPENAPPFEELAGSWDDERSAEEIIEDLRQSRHRTREVNLWGHRSIFLIRIFQSITCEVLPKLFKELWQWNWKIFDFRKLL